MNKRNENKLTSYEGIFNLPGDNRDKVQSVAGFNDSVTSFSCMVTEIKAKSSKHQQVKHRANTALKTRSWNACCLFVQRFILTAESRRMLR
jgi:hypothetical protein